MTNSLLEKLFQSLKINYARHPVSDPTKKAITPDRNTREIVSAAFSRDELPLLLMGAPEYAYLPPRSPSPWKTDLSELLSALYEDANLRAQPDIKVRLERAIHKILDTYEGIVPAAMCLLFETLRQSKGRSPLNLDLNEIGRALSESISKHKVTLLQDRSGPGRDYYDGLYGELKLLSQNTRELGGPAFCE